MVAGVPAIAQTPPPGPTPDAGVPATVADPSLGITVTATKLDEARGSIQPSLGATRYEFTPSFIETVPLGQGAALNQVLLRAPGVVQDSYGQIHVRGDHGNLQYRLDGVQLPEGLSRFSQFLLTRSVESMSLLTGALPAQYGLRTAGVVDIAVKSGTSAPGGDLSITGGSRSYAQPAGSYGGRSGNVDYFVTGQYLHNGLGVENPTASQSPIHDSTDQWYGLAKVTGLVDEQTRLSFIAGAASGAFQIPNVPWVVPNYQVYGFNQWNSGILDQRQWEQTYFGIASLQKKWETLDVQLSGFMRYSGLTYQPDAIGDLLYNGQAPWTNRTSLTVGVQGDAAWKVAKDHTVRGGFLVQRERSTAYTSGNVLPLVDDPANPGQLIPSDQPVGYTDGFGLTGWTYSVYVQDEWRIVPTVTLNVGLRFDAVSGITNENQLSPRINLVWTPDSVFSVRAGYSRYFTPPPLVQVSASSIGLLNNTVVAPEVLQNSPVRAERADYFDVGVTAKPLRGLTVGLSAWYKIGQNVLDEGQFGAPIVLTSFNYASALQRGVEFNASYDDGPWSLYFNGAWGASQGRNINSAQYNFGSAELAYIRSNYIFLDHNQGWTMSAGAAYTFNLGTDRATQVAADMLYGSGLRTTLVTPNDTALPSYTTLNASVVQGLPIGLGKGTQLRFDAINLLDSSYQLRDGQGVGVGAPQYGQRRTFLLTLAQKF
ncbi:MAG: TonB-dependent receptor [Reyranellaceae bacterium]